MKNMLSTRDAFGDGITDAAGRNDRVYVIDCDISKSTKTTKFAKKFPKRHINVGIAEQNAAGFAAGLATIGMIPFVSTYAVFGSMRMCEQVRTSICYPNLNVKIACSHAGLTPGNDGVTHQAIEDMGIYRTIPGMSVVMPADYNSARVIVEKAVYFVGPMYLRFTRDAIPVFYKKEETFEIGKGKLIKKGRDISLISIGDMLHQVLEAADILERKGVSVEIIDMHTLKPLDEGLILDSLNRTGKIITVEDHNIINGLGSAAADVIAEAGKGILRKIGLKDCFAESGDYCDLIRKYEMDASYILSTAKNIL